MKALRRAQGKKAFIVTGLGYGDEGKGTTTHWLSVRHKAHTVIRTGGPQALHRVVTSDGTEHVFSQFGSGTPRGAATHLSRHMLIDPHAILVEGEELRARFNFVFEAMTIHEDALVITPFQAIAGRVQELLRGKNRRGSVGIGVGETMFDSEILKDGAIRAKDFANPHQLREKLEAIRRYKWAALEEFADRASGLPDDIGKAVRIELAHMDDHSEVTDWMLKRCAALIKRVRVVDTEYVAKHILGTEGTVVFEGSQGVLLDRYHGFHPFTTKVRATPATSYEILRECRYDGEVKSLGVLRAYHTRHGGGPFVCESKVATEILPDESNKVHPWQGNFRVGIFDAIAARYAIEACRGQIDALIMTCVDRVASHADWKLCTSYALPHSLKDVDPYLEMCGRSVICIKCSLDESTEKLKHQEVVGRLLDKCNPDITSISNPWRDDRKKFTEMFVALVEEYLKFPVAAVSIGPTEADKIEL